MHRRVGCWRVLLREAGEGDDNFCPHVFAAEERDLSLMVIDDDFGDGQPQPRAPLGPAVRTVALGEFFKHRRLRGSLNAGAEVADRNAQLIPDRVQGDQDLPAVFRKLHRVGQEVIQHLHQPFGVAIGQHYIVIGGIDTAQRYACPFGIKLVRHQRRIQRLGQVQRLHPEIKRAGFDFLHIQNTVDQQDQPVTA